MSISITQVPAQCSLVQSPTIFTVSESTAVIYSSSFQYVADLYYWSGTPNASGSVPQYVLTKYPNTSNVGIFDVGRILNSTLTDLAEQNASNVKYFVCDFYWQYLSGSSYVTGSHVKTLRYKALDGYGIFQESIGQEIATASVHWPLMTSGPATQSFLDTNAGNLTVYTGFYGLGNASVCDNVRYSGSLGNAKLLVSGNLDTQNQTQFVPIGPNQTGFPLSVDSTYFTIQPYSSSTALGAPILFEEKCIQKYPNVRIKWKNRFGQFDYFNFDMVSRTSFQTTNRSYQPQLGSWESTGLSYQNYDSSNLNYIVDSKQSLSVNTDWIPESYNEILKQLMVSEEIYWITNENTNELLPITIATETIQFKTGVVDKTIQYAFDFNFGQGYKLIL